MANHFRTPQREALLERAMAQLGLTAVTESQQEVFFRVFSGPSGRAGQNLYVSGAAGAGKSVTRDLVFAAAKMIYSDGEVANTATSGIVAIGGGGVTWQSYFGFGVHEESTVEQLVLHVKANKRAVKRIEGLALLIMDESLCLKGTTLIKLSEVVRIIKGAPEGKLFGNAQIVMFGHALQLAPVEKHNPNPLNRDFLFRASIWFDLVPVTQHIYMQGSQRHANAEHREMLRKVSLGEVDQAVHDYLAPSAGRHRDRDQPGAPVPIRLRPRKQAVFDYNEERLGRIPGQVRVFHARDAGDPDLLTRAIADSALRLKEGAHVICMYNLPQLGLAKGSQGTVVGCSRSFDLRRARPGEGEPPIRVAWHTPGGGEAREHDMYPQDFKNETIEGVVLCCRRQYPLALAYAMTIHRSQGLTLPRVEVDLTDVWEAGQAYVALSRAPDRDGLRIVNFPPTVAKLSRVVMANPLALDHYRRVFGRV
jgi:ATP-dependent DNA helicase PIF1